MANGVVMDQVRALRLAERWERESDKLIVLARQGTPNEISGQLGEATSWRLAAYELREAMGLLPQPEGVRYDERR